MKKHILCLGDSNTHGYCADPADCADGGIRFNEDERWTKLLQKYLGEDYLVIEEGLSGRTTCFSDPLFEGLSALEYIHPCLKSHEPIDLLIIMLGTNDTKDRFCASGACIGLGMGRLVKKAMDTPCWGDHAPNILVIAPPPIEEGMLTSPVAPTMGTCSPARWLLPWAAAVSSVPGNWPGITKSSAACWAFTSWMPAPWAANLTRLITCT